MTTSFILNGRNVSVNLPKDTPLLWVLRDELHLKGTKFGCGIGECGTCTIHIGGKAARACITLISEVEGAHITTIEGAEAQEEPMRSLQAAWDEVQVPQCGYCQSGQIMQAVLLLKDNPNPTDEEIDSVMCGNLCRCMAYRRIRKAIHLAAEKLNALKTEKRPEKTSPKQQETTSQGEK